MRIWLDALTAKQARLMGHLARKAEAWGHEVLLTVRDYDFAPSIARRIGMRHTVVGTYGGETLEGKLAADINRMEGLLKLVAEFKPDVLVSYPSPSAVRVAYGLGIRIIVYSDSPHSVHPHRLTVPLADYLVHSALIPRSWYDPYITPWTRIVTFRGVEEYEWIQGYDCKRTTRLTIEEPFIVYRPPEYKASYYKAEGYSLFLGIVEEALRRGYRIIVMPRYPDQYEALKKRYGSDRRVQIVYREAVETLDLYCSASGVITGGATMAREAALMCKPAISLYPTFINSVLEALGLPIRQLGPNVEPREVIDTLEKIEEKCPRDVINAFEPPSSALRRVLAQLEERS